ncbi:MAG: dienelactone hydrolase family protein [Dehalococcoidia bacterium]|nr:dienelactone hydrolase family protein [Dehalococcoidia bacterium]
MKKTIVSFPSGELLLEGIVAIPEGAGAFPAVIVCHPHPLYGGSMDNNVVHSLCETLTEASFVSFKFNFRGVGGSQGEFGQGIGEQADVEAAISFIRALKEVDSERIGVAGYSAGAGFGLPIGSSDGRIKALAAVSPPLNEFNFDFLKSSPKQKFLVSGSRDNSTAADEFLQFCQSLAEPKQCEIIEGADHSWWEYESRLAAQVTAFFIKVL